MNEIIKGELIEGQEVVVQKESDTELFKIMKREVQFVIGGMAYVKDCGWFFKD